MRLIALALLSLIMAFTVNTASAGQILAVEASGNYNNVFLGNWHPTPDPIPPEWEKGKFTTTIMFDLDDNGCDGFVAKCKAKAIIKGPYYNFTTPWIGYSSHSLSLSNSGIDFQYNLVYDVNDPQIDAGSSLNFVGINGVMQGQWDVSTTDLSKLIGRMLPITQYNTNSNASYGVFTTVPGVIPRDDTLYIMETGLENVRFYFVPEPSSIALMGLAFAGLAVARRRKS